MICIYFAAITEATTFTLVQFPLHYGRTPIKEKFMSLLDLTPETLRELLTLAEKKETLLAQIARLDVQFASIAIGKASAPAIPKPATEKTSKPGKSNPQKSRRSVKETVLDALKTSRKAFPCLNWQKLRDQKRPACIRSLQPPERKSKG